MASTISAGTTSGTAIAISGDTTGALALQTNGTTTAVTIDTSQNVGIGTATPSSFGKLAVVNGTVGVANTGIDGTTGICYSFQSPTYGKTYQNTIDGSVSSTYSASVIAFNLASGANATTESMRILGANLLLGETTRWRSVGRISMTTGGEDGIAIKTSAAGLIVRKTSYGNSYIGLWENNGGSIVGSITTDGSTTAYNTSSDYRLKENIAPMTGALATVSLLKPVTYTWKESNTLGQGFIAHELQAVVPDCVHGEKDAVDKDGKIIPQGIDTSFLVATLTAAIQELNANLSSTKLMLTEISNKVDAQAITIAELQARTT
jgi:hypothetical protein